MARVQTAAAEAIYLAAETFVDNALRRDDSLFTPGSAIWSLAGASDLDAGFVQSFTQRPDTTKRRFAEKFRDQIGDASPQTIQLAAEVLYVYFLIDIDVLGQTKRTLIDEVLSWSAEPVSMPAELAATLDGGIASTGTGFNTRRPNYVAYLIEFAKMWKGLAASELEAALADPWRFEGLVHSVEAPGGLGEREALLHLVFPDTFEPIVSIGMKQQIVAGFPQAPGGAEGLDRRLAEIRSYLTPEYGETFTFYQDDVAALWRTPRDPKTQPVTVWWVNQGQTYAEEHAGGYLWAPKANEKGQTMEAWTNMELVKVGDVIVHYAKGIRALSRISKEWETAERPSELAKHPWEREGYKVLTRYTELAEPIPLDALPPDVRRPSQGPFDTNGDVKQRYLLAVPKDMAGALEQFLGDSWPGRKSMERHPIYASIAEKGFRFPDWLVTDYLLSLATKPFVLLSGISGTGKTKDLSL